MLIDLKIPAFRPADAGQINFYANWFKALLMADGDMFIKDSPVSLIVRHNFLELRRHRESLFAEPTNIAEDHFG